MSSAPRPAESSEPAVSTERKGSAVIAKVRVKLLDDNSLRLLSQLIDQSALPGNADNDRRAGIARHLRDY